MREGGGGGEALRLDGWEGDGGGVGLVDGDGVGVVESADLAVGGLGLGMGRHCCLCRWV